jgi:hypothetical protein
MVILPERSDQMPITKSELFRRIHGICKMKNVAFFGGYQKCFAHFLKRAYEQKLVWGFNV